jgi:hypothetical protein
MGSGSGRDPQRIKCAPFLGLVFRNHEGCRYSSSACHPYYADKVKLKGSLLFASKRSIGVSSA